MKILKSLTDRKHWVIQTNLFAVGWLMVPLVFTGCGKGTSTSQDCVASQTLSTSGKQVGIGDQQFGGNALKQSFTAATTAIINSVTLNLGINSGAIPSESTQTVNVAIMDSTDATTYSSGSVKVSAIRTNGTGPYTITMDSYGLTQGTVYSLHVTPSYPLSASNFVFWLRVSDGVDHYTGGAAYYQTGSSTFSNALWGTLSDFVFQVGNGC